MKHFCSTFLLLVIVGTSQFIVAQNILFRVAANTGFYTTEIGSADIPYPLIELLTPEISTENFKAEFFPGFEAELIFPFSNKMSIGVELESTRLRGYNDTPPIYNYYFTPYNPIDTFITDPVSFKTSLLNILFNWRYYLLESSSFKPFVKLTGGIAFVGTDFTFKNAADAGNFETNVLYTRGTSNSDNPKWPAFYAGGSLGFDYQVSDKISLQLDGGASLINTDIVNGVPNFSYENIDGKEKLKHRNRASMNLQFSAGLVYSLESIDLGSSKGKSKMGKKGKSGRTDSKLPFYRKK